MSTAKPTPPPQAAATATPRRKRPKLGEAIANDLRRMIVDGTLEAGTNLSGEDDLAAQFGVSRPTMREAIRILEAEALLTPSPTSYGALVITRPHPGMATKYLGLLMQSEGVTLSDIYQARDIFEPAAVRIVAETKGAEAAEVLAALIARRRLVMPNWPAEVALTVSFHEALMELSGNKTLALLLKVFHNIFERHLGRARAQRDQSLDDDARSFALSAHERLVALIRDGRGAEAEAFWTQHLQTTRERYLRLRELDHVIDMLD